jgi:hypothetical protein
MSQEAGPCLEPKLQFRIASTPQSIQNQMQAHFARKVVIHASEEAQQLPKAPRLVWLTAHRVQQQIQTRKGVLLRPPAAVLLVVDRRRQ